MVHVQPSLTRDFEEKGMSKLKINKQETLWTLTVMQLKDSLALYPRKEVSLGASFGDTVCLS